MSKNTPPYDARSLEQLAQIIIHARPNNGGPTNVSHPVLLSNLLGLGRIFRAKVKLPEQMEASPWTMIQEEHPLPIRRYKIFSKALDTADPLAALRELSRDRTPSELYLLQVRINSRARSNLSNVEKGIPELKAADWSGLSKVQQLTIRLHIRRLEKHYRRNQSRVPNPKELLINEAMHELARIFAILTHFDGIDTDLPYSANSPFVNFVCLALTPFVNEDKLNPNTISARWSRLNGFGK